MVEPPLAHTPGSLGADLAAAAGDSPERIAESAIARADPGHRGAFSTELRAISRRAEQNAIQEQRGAKRWGSLYFVVGLPAAVLAAIAGATALASTANHIVAGVIALTAAGLTAAATFLDSASRRTTHENLAAAWKVLANDANVHLIIDIHDDVWLKQSARLYLQELLDRERKLLQGKAPDSEAEAERRAQAEAVRAQEAASRAQEEAARARAAERRALDEANKLAVAAAHIDPSMARSVFKDIQEIDVPAHEA